MCWILICPTKLPPFSSLPRISFMSSAERPFSSLEGWLISTATKVWGVFGWAQFVAWLRRKSMFELEDGGKDLVVKILDPTLQSSQLLEFKVRDLKEKGSGDVGGHFSLDFIPCKKLSNKYNNHYKDKAQSHFRKLHLTAFLKHTCTTS